MTGSRAEYGLLSGLMRRIDTAEDFVLQLIVTGTHFSEAFGSTWKEIEADGFVPAAKVPMAVDGDTPADVGRGLGECTVGMSTAFASLKPDLIVVLGDRSEILATLLAATVARIPIAHLHGGEATFGSYDDSVRHAITKLSHLHFVAAEPYKRRIVQMGENPDNVHVVGAIGLDAIAEEPVIPRDTLCADIGIDTSRGFLLVTYHPETLGEDPAVAIRDVADALLAVEDLGIVVTGVNADPGHEAIRRAWQDLQKEAPDRVVLVQSLGQRRYLSALRHCEAVVGNSSSGIIEAPAVGTPTVNIGSRQDGRLRSAGVIDCPTSRDKIVEAIAQARRPAFRESVRHATSAYGAPGAAEKIMDVLSGRSFSGLTNKHFVDLPA